MSLKITSMSTSSFMNIMSNKKTLFSSDTSRFYRLDKESGLSSGILKIYSFEKLPQQMMPIFSNIWPREIIAASKKDNFDELLKVLELIVVDNMLRGHITQPVDSSFINFDDCIRGEDLTTVTNRFKKLNMLLEKGIDYDIAFPDLMTKGNLKINPRTNELKVFDLEGLQVDKMFAFSASDLLGIEENEQFGDLYLKFENSTPYLDLKINRAILLIYYIKSLTNICLPLAVDSRIPKNISTEVILSALGLRDDDLLAPFIRSAMINGDIPKVPNEVLDDFSKKYVLKPTRFANATGKMFETR